jgi:hypothetical protein
MAQFYLLDPHYDEHHMGRPNTEVEIIFVHIYIYILKFQITKCNLYLTNEIAMIVRCCPFCRSGPMTAFRRRHGTMTGTLLS